MRRFTAAATAAATTVLLVGCVDDETPPAGNGTRASAPAPSDSRPHTRVLVDLAITGGFIGRQDRVLLRTDGSYETTTRNRPHRTGRLNSPELTALRRDVATADFDALPTRMIDPNARDLFQYRITYAGHTVVTDRTEQVPALERVLERLERLVS